MTPTSVDDLRPSLCAHNFAVWQLVAEELHILGLDPFTIDFLALVYHIVVDNAIQFPLAIQAELVRPRSIGMKKNTTTLEPFGGDRRPVLLPEGPGSWRSQLGRLWRGLKQD